MLRYILPTLLLVSPALADARTDCPNQKPCKIIMLNEEEEKALLGQNMVLDTAMQGRAIDLGGVVTYFRNKLSTAPMGDVPALSGSKDETPKEKAKK